LAENGRRLARHSSVTQRWLPDHLDDISSLDVLLIPGGPGQEMVMDDERVLSLIRTHAESGRIIFSVCTGALVCGAAGILRGRRATTHWAAFDLLRYFGATPVDTRVVVDDNIVTAAGITAGIDANTSQNLPSNRATRDERHALCSRL
jgi:putative intracellular protease/amidase